MRGAKMTLSQRYNLFTAFVRFCDFYEYGKNPRNLLLFLDQEGLLNSENMQKVLNKYHVEVITQ